MFVSMLSDKWEGLYKMITYQTCIFSSQFSHLKAQVGMSAQRTRYSLHMYFMVAHVHTLLIDRISLSAFPDQKFHYRDVIMSAMASQITSFWIVYSTLLSGADQRKHQCSASLAFMRGIHQWPVNSSHNGPVTWKMFPFDDVITWYHTEAEAKVMIYDVDDFSSL